VLRWEHAEVIEEMKLRMSLEPWEAQSQEKYSGASFWHDTKGVQPGLFAAERVKEDCWRGRIHHASLQHEKGFEHYWTEGHYGVTCLTVRRKEKRVTRGNKSSL